MAGRVAASRAPAVIADLAEVELVSPVLRERGINSLVAIPLIADDAVIGVVHAGSEAYAQFTDDDARLLELIAERIALAIRSAALIEAERAAQERLAVPERGERGTVVVARPRDDAPPDGAARHRTLRGRGGRRPRGRRLDLAGRDSRSRKAGCRRRCATGFWRNPPSPDDDGGSARVIRTGLEEVLADLDTDPAPLAAVTRGRPGIAPTVELLRPRALVYMPLRARDRHARCAGLDPDERELHARGTSRPFASWRRGPRSRSTTPTSTATPNEAVTASGSWRWRARSSGQTSTSDRPSSVSGALVVDEYADRCAFHLAGEEATSVVAVRGREGRQRHRTGEPDPRLTDAARKAIATGRRRAGFPAAGRRRAACIPSWPCRSSRAAARSAP